MTAQKQKKRNYKQRNKHNNNAQSISQIGIAK